MINKLPNPRLTIECDNCTSNAAVVMATHENGTGGRIEWPNTLVKSDGIYFKIECPLCGLR